MIDLFCFFRILQKSQLGLIFRTGGSITRSLKKNREKGKCSQGVSKFIKTKLEIQNKRVGNLMLHPLTLLFISTSLISSVHYSTSFFFQVCKEIPRAQYFQPFRAINFNMLMLHPYNIETDFWITIMIFYYYKWKAFKII